MSLASILSRWHDLLFLSAGVPGGRHKDLPARRRRRRAQCELPSRKNYLCHIRWTSAEMRRLDAFSVRHARVQKHENVRVHQVSRRLRTKLYARERVLLSSAMRSGASVYTQAQTVCTIVDVAAASSRADTPLGLRCVVVRRRDLTPARSHTRVWISYVSSNRMLILCCCRESCLM